MKRTVLEAAAILGIVALLAIATAFLHPGAPPWRVVELPQKQEFEISVQQIASDTFADALWIDARATKDYQAGHLEGALSLNDDNFEDQLWENNAEFTDLDRVIVVYCDGMECQRSSKIAQLLRDRLQLRNVYVLKGDWRELP